jgi:small subunit ribosomal protein S13
LARIAGIDLPKDKRIEVALTYIYGIGATLSEQILAKAGVDQDTRVHALSEEDVAKIREAIGEDFKIEGALRSDVQINIKRLMDIGCYRGLRHRRNLPVRGQRTHTNARSRRGRKRVVGVKKKGR